MSQNPHAVLQVPPGAPPAVVTAAYRKLALEHHPDRAGEGERMRELNAAYEALSAPARPDDLGDPLVVEGVNRRYATRAAELGAQGKSYVHVMDEYRDALLAAVPGMSVGTAEMYVGAVMKGLERGFTRGRLRARIKDALVCLLLALLLAGAVLSVRP